jgi:hypothetical protein
MRYIFLVVGIWNTIGALNFIVFPELMAKINGYPMGNMWDSLFMGGIAIIFALIYFSFFKREPSRDMLYLVYFFAFGKFWVFASTLFCYIYYNMPLRLFITMGVGDLLMGVLFMIYIVNAQKKSI